MAEPISENNKRILQNTLYLYLRMFILLIISLFTSRVVFQTLGVDNYGIYNIVGSIIVFFTFFTDGLLGATKRFITAELPSGDVNALQRVFSTAMNAHFLVSLVILVTSESFGLYFLNNFMNIPAGRELAANVVFQFSIFSAILMVIQSPYNGALIANEKMSIYAYFSIFDVVSKLLIIFLIKLLNGDKLILYASLMFIISVLYFLINIFYVRHILPMCRYHRGGDKQLFRSMFSYTGWTLFGSGTYILSNQGVAVLINLFFGVAVNAALGISNTIANIVNRFVKDFQVAFSPQITKYYVAKNIEELNKLVIRSSRYTSYLVLVFLVPICFEASDLLTIWLGVYPNYSVEFCILTLLCIFLESISVPLGFMITSDANIKIYQIFLSSCYMLNFFLCGMALLFFSIPYVVMIIRLAVDILLVFVRVLSAKSICDGFRYHEWIKKVFFDILFVLIPILLSAFFIIKILFTNIWIKIIFTTSSLLVITAFSIFFIGLDVRERSLIIDKIKPYICILCRKEKHN